MEVAYLQTPMGIAEFQGDANGLASISILNDNKPIGIVPHILEDAIYQFQEYFEGTRENFDLKLNPTGTDFQKKVWDALCEIPYGKTVSYLELSKKLGDPKAIRAVAAANGKNPLWIVVPCHRVIGSNGDLIGYAGGLHRKKWLLEHESPVKQMALF
ncbi:cysteine methyltransferase [Flagellimonas aquimarina]|uniref:Methylated-DNA--protein-cysteine methyltransferase n=1 Tax=Flagellimonas aquimarina TaxID=2201895 RepID=A0A316LI41_9FLAO|nr:methylated-DNA--[protein]-cysteine S-methyltransferase [Allomuricauda koreensis]PWL39740.1 cysteine methyltransferase [Allomuricauda koreensis]